MESFVRPFAEALSLLAHLPGSSYGLAVVAIAVAVRLVLLPLTLRLAEQGWHRQQRMQALQPKLDALRERHAKDPMAYARAAKALHRQHGITSGLGGGLLVSAVQAPLGIGIYAAIRRSVAAAGSFLWIPRLARPDFLLALAVAALTWAAIMLNPAMPAQMKTALQMLPVLVTFLMVWHLAAGLGLYWAGSSSVNVLQAALLRRRVARRQS
ncbi:MAG: membrane protein insertase YidC [Xanthomonadaceae bacterium]|nr:membrane protein insertase YidC [Xanthomonadaceae bacterium]MDE1964775.1 membrane protein insertase YidC [Xanthomonadaceae bacterium]